MTRELGNSYFPLHTVEVNWTIQAKSTRELDDPHHDSGSTGTGTGTGVGQSLPGGQYHNGSTSSAWTPAQSVFPSPTKKTSRQMSACAACGVELVPTGKRGRPRKFCRACRPVNARVKRQRLPIAKLCVECGVWFETYGNFIYCSNACRRARQHRGKDPAKRLERWRRHERTRPKRDRSKRGSDGGSA